jgi:hypothetical protein
VITFANEEWIVKAPAGRVGPDNNLFSESNAFTDAAGHLHLRVTRDGTRWLSAEIYSKAAIGYGVYTATLESSPHNDPNVVFGMFTWAEAENESREIDMLEIGFGTEPTNSQYVVQPWNAPGNLRRVTLPSGPTTHRMTYLPDRLVFESFSGRGANPLNRISEWVYTGKVPAPDSPNLNFRFNLWLLRGAAPQDGKEKEVVVSSFVREPLPK